jgi:hypothetical protein
MHCAWALAENGRTPFWLTATMKEVIITCLIAICCVPAVAEWDLVVINDTGTRHHIDSATIRKEGDIRRVWTISD